MKLPMKLPDYYHILGVSETATAADIKRAYRKLVFMHHPDRNGGSAEAEEKFKVINRAYEVLSDPVARGLYDAQLQASCTPQPEANQQPTSTHTPGYDPTYRPAGNYGPPLTGPSAGQFLAVLLFLFLAGFLKSIVKQRPAWHHPPGFKPNTYAEDELSKRERSGNATETVAYPDTAGRRL